MIFINKILYTILSLLLITICYVILPTVSFKFIGIYVVAMSVTFIVGILSYIKKFNIEGRKKAINYFKPFFYTCVVFIIMILVSLNIFRANSYKSLLNTPKYKNFSKEISPIDITKIPTVNPTYAKLLADKKLGEETSLGSRVELGELTLQNINGKLYYVSPLLHSGFFKWLTNHGTPGYIMVSATDDKDVKLVQSVDGKPINIKYQPNAFFHEDLERKIYVTNFTKGITDFTFELDDKGNPFWTATLYTHKIGLSGNKVEGIAIVNAQTGEVKNYDIKNTPKWVDRIQPMKFVEDNLNYWGKYIHGYFNFSGKDKLKTTEGTGIVYNDDKCYYYTGLTSVGRDESSIGFALIDTRTMETTIFKVSGATEKAGMKSAEGKVQNLKYEASFPILINIENIPTYFTTLNDKNGLTKLFAMISVTDYNVVGIGENIIDCKSNYLKGLAGKGNYTAIGSTGNVINLSGTIKRINSSVVNGSTVYTFVLNEKPDLLFLVSSTISNELPITRDNDKVFISYVDTKQVVINCSKFDNLNFNQKISNTEKKVIKDKK